MSEANHYIDTSTQETEDREPISNPGVKLCPSQHPWYEEVRGESVPKCGSEEPKVARPLLRSVRRCCAHPGEANYDGVFDSGECW